MANGVYDATPITYNGITYAGQTHACALTDVNGKLKPAEALAGTNIDASFHKPTYTLAIDHDLWDGTPCLCHHTVGLSLRRHQLGGGTTGSGHRQAENITDYEVGIKSDFTVFGMPVRTTWTAISATITISRRWCRCPMLPSPPQQAGGACTQAAVQCQQLPQRHQRQRHAQRQDLAYFWRGI